MQAYTYVCMYICLELIHTNNIKKFSKSLIKILNQQKLKAVKKLLKYIAK